MANLEKTVRDELRMACVLQGYLRMLEEQPMTQKNNRPTCMTSFMVKVVFSRVK